MCLLDSSFCGTEEFGELTGGVKQEFKSLQKLETFKMSNGERLAEI